MTVVRELLINFGAKLDEDSVREVDSKVKGMASAAQAVMNTAFVFGVGKFMFAINEMASDVEENMNVISQSFGDSKQEVIAWSEEFGDVANRSKFDLQQMAATFGAVLNPLMEQNTGIAANMAKALSELSVDLASFYNMADSDVLQKLRGGLTGEAEGMKQLGIVMNETTLEAFALSEGINKSIKSMSIAEKTALRYNFILSQTVTAQGDAIRTADGWANAKKGLIAKIKEIATTAGLVLLPVMSKMVNFARLIVNAFGQAVKGTSFFEAALLSLAAVAVAVGVKLLIAFAPVIIPILKLAAMFGLLVLAVEDFYTFLQGGDSLIGRFIDSVFGPGSAAEALKKLKATFEAVSAFVTDVFWPWLKQSGPRIGLFARAIGAAFIEVAKYIREVWEILDDFLTWVARSGIPKLLDLIARLRDARAAGALSINGRGGADGKNGSDGKNYLGSGGPSKKGSRPSGFRVSVPSTKGPGGQSITMVSNNTVQVTATNTTAGLADEVADKSSDTFQKMQERTAAALQQRIRK